MKIGVLTLPLHSNYGGILQAYALQTVLERMGHSVVVFNIEKEFPKLKWKLLPKRIVKKILGMDSVIFKEWRDKRDFPIVDAALLEFRKQYLKERCLKSIDEILNVDIDAIIVGSDQVWRPQYFCSMWKTGIEDAYLYFMRQKKMKKIAYAASLGVDCWEANSKDTLLIRDVAPLFNFISVREQSAVSLLNRYIGASAKVVLDPTLLLNENDYLNLIKCEDVKRESEICVYLLDPSKEKILFVNKIAKERKLKPIFVNKIDVKNSASAERRKKTSIESWLNAFASSDFVITDSFHACVFSIIFEKQFVAIGNASRGLTRFNSLLETFGLRKNLIVDLNEYDNGNDWSVTCQSREILKELKKESLCFLKKALE